MTAGPDRRGPELSSDCSRCFGLCCVLLPFSADAGFGADKPGGTPCHHLRPDDRCDIHAHLREEGWPGCTVFECFGAGQQVSQVTYRGRSWREPGDRAPNRGEMAAVLSVMRRLHEALVHLEEVRERSPEAAAARLRDRILDLVERTPTELLAVDVDALMTEVRARLRAASERVRGSGPAPGHDLAGQDLRTTNLRRADLHGSLLIAADLRGADLTESDLLGADLRDTDLRGADLSGTLFVTQPQVNAARGDRATRLPTRLRPPAHWR